MQSAPGAISVVWIGWDMGKASQLRTDLLTVLVQACSARVNRRRSFASVALIPSCAIARVGICIPRCIWFRCSLPPGDYGRGLTETRNARSVSLVLVWWLACGVSVVCGDWVGDVAFDVTSSQEVYLVGSTFLSYCRGL